MSKNLSELSARVGIKKGVFDILGEEAKAGAGTPSPEALAELASRLLVDAAIPYGAASFYDFLKPDNQGKRAYVCNGSACLCAGTQDKVYETLASKLKPDEIGHMTCLGRCHENAAFHLDGKNYSGLRQEQILRLLKGETLDSDDQYTVDAIEPAILTGEPLSDQACEDIIRKTLQTAPSTLIEQLTASKLRGRGGAGFSAGMKLKFCAAEDANEKYIVCNADEGDPGAYTDRYLMEERPIDVLLGMVIAGYAVGASWGIVYIRGEYPRSIDKTQEAVNALRDIGLLGDDLLGSGFSFRIRVVRAQGAYICGEESALLSSLEGQRGEVRVRPPYPAQQGLFNKPTVVNNVETLAAMPHIVSRGSAFYANIGTDKSSGTKLLSLDSYFNNPGVFEVPMGTPLRVVLHELAGGFTQPIKALQIGGPLGGIVPVGEIDNLTVDFESFSKAGFLLGHASVVCIPESMPMVEYLEHLFAFTAVESCGKCFPCRLGSKRGQEMFANAKQQKISEPLLRDLLEVLEKGSLCGLGGGIPLPIYNALDHFYDELKPYLETEAN